MPTDCKNCPLRRTATFTDVSKDQLAYIRRAKVGELRVEAGTPIMMEGTNAPQLYTALSGMGLRYKLRPGGERQVVNFVFPGDFIGLQAGVMGEMKHSVEAATSMVLCVFDRSELWSMFRSQPALAFDLTWMAAAEEHFLGEALVAIGRMSGIERVCWGLKRLYLRCEAVGLGRNDDCPFPFRQQDLADALGLSLVHTNKILGKLKRMQVLSVSEGRLRILDHDQMNAMTASEIDLPDKRPLI